MNIVIYTKDRKNLWNEFVKNAKNGHFFFQRDYLEYHSDRFEDFSLMVFDDADKLIAVLPANIKDGILYSHQGLTFGGFLADDKMKTETMLKIFEYLKVSLKSQNIEKIIYKCIPYIYHRKPSEEDRYALFRNDARLIRRDITTTIDLKNKIPYQEQRSRAIKKAIKNDLIFERSKDFDGYWKIIEEILRSQHGAKPVHSLEEIKNLAFLFPENIKLFVATKDNRIFGGVLIFENEQIVHTQYLANSSEGRNLGALDFVIDRLINEVYRNKNYFDFGTSNEDEGRYLNTGLMAQKEGFGARAVAHDFYELEMR
jgi:hypothetical protein